MEVREVMIAPVDTVAPTETIAAAARLMARHAIGALPVILGDRILGIVTDRDIVVRGIAKGLALDLPVTHVMSSIVTTCPESACLDDVLDAMVVHGIRRIPIHSEAGKLTGIVSLDDLMELHWDKEMVARAFADTCRTRKLQPLNAV